ncbi:MAG: GDP-L-fucose synthase [bacterium]
MRDVYNSIHVAGHTGLVGSAITAELRKAGYQNLVLRTIDELDLTDPVAVDGLYAETKPDAVIVAAAKVGGILANATYPADFIRINLQIEINLFDAAFRHGVKRLIFLGSSCIYPKLAPQPLKEEYFLTGPLEETNDAYAIAKIAGVMMGRSYNRQHGFDAVSLMPTNLYGPCDNFNLATSHVLPALIRKCHEAKRDGNKELVIWGTGSPLREFLYVEDLAEAVRYVLEQPREKIDQVALDGLMNVGVGEDLSIRELASLIAEVVGFKGELTRDTSKPDGTPRKLMDVSRINRLGWKAKTSLREGIAKTYAWYLENEVEILAREAQNG